MKKVNHWVVISFSSAIFNLMFATAISVNVASCGSDPDTGEITKTSGDTAKVLSQPDVNFLTFAIETNVLEVAVGKLAQKQGTDTEIIEMGQMLEEDHKKSLVETTKFGMAHKVEFSDELSESNQAKYDTLEMKKGTEFDWAFCDMMVNGHKEAIAKFEAFINEGDNDKLKDWAKKTLPTLQKHLEHAEHYVSTHSNERKTVKQ
ncbi:MAG TPA: DUF4142 domain-containing protein [Flavobacteriales bacterium]|nr:DUF4142 domain-containing protein [Flavobacteriales bacterium]